MLVINCSNCRTPVQVPQGARSIRCAFRRAVTRKGDARAARPPLAAHAPLSLYNHQLQGLPPNAHGRKSAVIREISYKNSRHELKGSISDAKCMLYLLVNKFRFP
ncbi:hypothetical protein TIFTF001_017456 [Ficus carica]|uniref:Zinc finger LSD1-type domain-containing protein n=1 Tax=Ficus carica TaxID=3494 RepID=A0AA88D9R1_FICCA|nr:hypothetical protein TIFTF001_017456 [Ficus carica]